MKQPVRLVDIMRICVAKASTKLLTTLQAADPSIVAINYDYGHLADVKERLLAKRDAQPTANRYPLVWLIEDFRVTQRIGIFGVGDVKIMILHTSKAEYTRQQREDLVIKPILVPIYNELLKQMKLSGYFMVYSFFPHDRIDRPHWGDPRAWNGKSYLFDEPLDGIELSNLQLQLYSSKCITV